MSMQMYKFYNYWYCTWPLSSDGIPFLTNLFTKNSKEKQTLATPGNSSLQLDDCLNDKHPSDQVSPHLHMI